MLLGKGSLNVDDLEGTELESPALEARDDLSNESALSDGEGTRNGIRVMRIDIAPSYHHVLLMCPRSRRQDLQLPVVNNGRYYLDAVRLDHNVAPLFLGHFADVVSRA